MISRTYYLAPNSRTTTPVHVSSWHFGWVSIGHLVFCGFSCGFCATKQCIYETSLVVWWSESLTTNREVPGSIPGSTMGIFLEGEDSRGDHGLGRLVEFRFQAPPDTTSSYITTHTPSGQRNCASWASQPQKSVTFLPCPGRRTTKSTKRTCGGIGEKKPMHLWIKITDLKLQYCKVSILM